MYNNTKLSVTSAVEVGQLFTSDPRELSHMNRGLTIN